MTRLVSYFHSYGKVFENAVLTDLTSAEQLPEWMRATTYGQAVLDALARGLRMQLYCADRDLFVKFILSDGMELVQAYHATMLDRTPWSAVCVKIINSYS